MFQPTAGGAPVVICLPPGGRWPPVVYIKTPSNFLPFSHFNDKHFHSHPKGNLLVACAYARYARLRRIRPSQYTQANNGALVRTEAVSGKLEANDTANCASLASALIIYRKPKAKVACHKCNVFNDLSKTNSPRYNILST